MPYINGLPTAGSAAVADIIALVQGGTIGVPGSGTTRQATVAQIVAAGLAAAVSGVFSGTVAAKLYDAGAIGSRTWSGANNIGMTPFIEAGTSGRTLWSGTVSGSLSAPAVIGVALITGSSIDASVTGGVTNLSSQVEIGTGHKGGGSGGNFGITVTGSSETGAVEYVAMRQVASTSAAASYLHTIAGMTSQSLLGAGATGYGALCGARFGLQVATGASVQEKIGAYVMSYTGDNVQGSVNDAAYAVWNQFSPNTVPGTTGWKVGFLVGHAGSLFFPISTTGTVFKAQANSDASSITVANLIDMSAVTTVTGNNIAMPNFTVTGAGVVNAAGSYRVGGTQVVGPRQTGWTAMTGSSDMASTFNIATVTLSQLASRVAAIQYALTIAHGLIGV